MRQPLIVGNWKMNGTSASNAALVSEMTSLLSNASPKAEIAICVPFVYLDQVKRLLENTSIMCGAQDVSVHLNGAYTGEISASMLVDLSCQYVIVGHSERREYHHESSLLIAQKTLAAQQAGLTPVICVGETLGQREAGQTLALIGEQLAAIKSVVGEHGLVKSVIAYEPVWAIGTGLTATPEQAQTVHQFIREQLGVAAETTQILYGGSVKADNAASLFAQHDIDGALVGGASLNAADFYAIVSAV
jgi:triosephosphate isomerase (TIM)